MKAITQTGETNISREADASFAVDTTFVLFFLSVELGRSFNFATFDTLLLTLSLLALGTLPYFLSNTERLSFKSWLLGRSAIAALAFALGWGFSHSIGTVVPEMFRFLPMTLLIVTAMVSCYIQFYGFFKLRFVK